MIIAVVASIWISAPPKGFGFGAQEYLAYQIAEGLVKKGHDVTLFATGDSKTSAKLVSVSPIQIMDMHATDPRVKDIFELANLSEAYKMANEFDLIHNQLLPYGLLFTPLTKTPTIHTLHHEIYKTRADFYLYERFKNQNYVSISQAQRATFPSLKYIDTVYNGIDTEFYSFKDFPANDYILYIGRMRRYKGIHTAIKIAQEMGILLKIASPMPSPIQLDYHEAIDYWKSEIEPQLGSHVEHIGLIGGAEKISLMQNAKALIFPVEREEPFGMTLIEAMSTGTPVIAYARGSMQEIITDGINGFLVNPSEENIRGEFTIKKAGTEGLQDAMGKIYSMPTDQYQKMRALSRKTVEEKFNIQKMVEGYEKVYEKILNNSKTSLQI